MEWTNGEWHVNPFPDYDEWDYACFAREHADRAMNLLAEDRQSEASVEAQLANVCAILAQTEVAKWSEETKVKFG